MQFVVPKLKLGQIVHAKVREQNKDGSLIIDFEGDLIRVNNKAGIKVSAGEEVEFIVIQLKPLRFRIQAQKPLGAGYSRQV